MTTKGRQEWCKRKWQELGSIEKLSRIEDGTIPLNIDRATSQDETFRPPSKSENKDNTQTTHQAKQAHITSSILHVLLQQWWSS
jgi:hypothetical protein